MVRAGVRSGDFLLLPYYRLLLIEYLYSRNAYTILSKLFKLHKNTFSFNQTNRMEICSYCLIFLCKKKRKNNVQFQVNSCNDHMYARNLHCVILYFFLSLFFPAPSGMPNELIIGFTWFSIVIAPIIYSRHFFAFLKWSHYSIILFVSYLASSYFFGQIEVITR